MEEQPRVPFRPHYLLDTPRDTSQMVVAGPKTFRRASRSVLSNKKDTPFNNFGSNRQNVNSWQRRFWLADNGYRLVTRDQGGADALIVAYLCRQGRYRELFQNNIKPHLYLALRFFPDVWMQYLKPDYIRTAMVTPIPDLAKLEFWNELSDIIKSSDDWEPRKRFYYFGKKTGHAGNYGMGDNRLVNVILEETQGQIVLPKSEAGRWLGSYHTQLFPEIQQNFQFNVKKATHEKRQLRNLHGYPFNITGRLPKEDHEYFDLFSWIPQSTVAGITELALIAFQSYIREHDKDWHVLQETHDSITYEAPDKEAEESALKLKECFAVELVSPVDGAKFTMKTDCKISAVGGNWAPYDKDRNPMGQKGVKI